MLQYANIITLKEAARALGKWAGFCMLLRRAGSVLCALQLSAKMPSAWITPMLATWCGGGGCTTQGSGETAQNGHAGTFKL